MIYVVVQPGPEPELPHDRVETIERFFAAIQDGEFDVLQEILTADAITRWPQSAERMTGPMACVRVYKNYPGGPPKARVTRIVGEGNVWIAELIADYGDETWHIVSVLEFEGPRIARMTDYFAPSFPAPDWRQEWVDHDEDVA